MTTGVKVTSGLVGLFMAICLDALIDFGIKHYHSTKLASSMGLTAFASCSPWRRTRAAASRGPR